MIQINCKDGSIHIYPSNAIVELIFNEIKVWFPTGKLHVYRGSEVKSIIEEGVYVWPKR